MNKKQPNNLIFNLIKNYSIVLISTIILFMVFVVYQQINGNYRNHEAKLREISNDVSNAYRNDNQRMRQLSLDMFKNADLIEPYYVLFGESLDDYIWWNLENSIGRENRDISLLFKRYMAQDESIKEVVIRLKGYDDVFYIERGGTAGIKLSEMPEIESNYKISKPLIDQATFDVLGTVDLYIYDDVYKNIVNTGDDFSIYSIFLLNDMNDSVVSIGQENIYLESYIKGLGNGTRDISDIATDLSSYKYHYVVLPNGYKSLVVASKSSMAFSNFQPILLWMAVGTLMIGSLIYLLRRMFKSYMLQVDDIVDVVKNIEFETNDRYINTDDKEGELLLISDSINDMLENIQRYVNDIYGLQIRQKDAELRALQAQINPHFMYNTLEYIRMNVLNEGLDDLSEVIFSFATLLRNNISAEKFITLKNELSFCEKYVFLYQIRHPDRIAYKFTMNDKMNQMIIPRFTIQPLIENYLIHGLDYKRMDNAISVSAYREDGISKIIIKDNGNGMAPEKLKEIREKLNSDTAMTEYGSESIGIKNVYERLKFYYKGNASLSVEHNYPRGLIVTIEIKE